MEKALSRRMFLTGSAAAAVSVASLVGCAPQQPPVDPEPTPQGPAPSAPAQVVSDGMAGLNPGAEYNYFKPVEGTVAFEADPITDISTEMNADLVVCGAGLAGITLALAGASKGMKVVLLEKTSTVNVRGSGVGSTRCHLVKEAGITFDETMYLNDAMKAANYRCDINIWKRWLEYNGEAVDWILEETKDSINPYINLPETGSAVDTFAGVNTYNDTIEPGSSMAKWSESIVALAVERGAEVLYSTPAVQLVQDASGKVTGVIAKGEDGKYIKVNAAKGVCLTTGGYENNWEMLKKYMRPEDLNVVAWRLPNTENTGDGHLMGAAVGGMMEPAPHIMMRDPGGVASANASMTFASCRWPRVNKNGLRFANEVISHNNLANSIARQPEGRDFIILAGPTLIEAMVATTYRNHTPGARKRTPEDIYDQVKDHLIVADTLDELAQKAGINAENLKATCARLTELYKKGVDEDYGTDPGMLMSYESGPYYCVKEGASNLVTNSGLQTDQYSAVLDKNGVGIPGLYAIGNCAGNMFHDTYPHELSGISHSRCIVFAYLLAKDLA